MGATPDSLNEIITARSGSFLCSVLMSTRKQSFLSLRTKELDEWCKMANLGFSESLRHTGNSAMSSNSGISLTSDSGMFSCTLERASPGGCPYLIRV